MNDLSVGALSGESEVEVLEAREAWSEYQLADGKCHWTKKYLGKHDVAYQGYNEGRGIWGVWEINSSFKGGFHIWPFGQGTGESQEVSEEVDTPSLLTL